MRIGVVVEYLHARGGTQRQALELARALAGMGHDVTVLARVLDRERCFPDLVRDLTVRAVHDAQASSAKSLRALRGARALAKRLTTDLGIHDYVSLATMRKASAELETLIAGERPFDILNAHDYGPAAWSAARARHDLTATVWQCNDPLFRWGGATGFLEAAVRRSVILYDRYRSRDFDAITVLDHTVARVVEERFGRRPKVVRSGVSGVTFDDLPSKSDARRSLGIGADTFVVLMLTLLNSEHRRAEDAVALAEQLSPGSLVLMAATVTDPSSRYAQRLEDLVARSPAKERIAWRREPLNGDSDLRTLLAAADVFFFPNQQQTWGLAVIEACMARLPVVVSNGAGVHEVFSDGVDAVIFPVGDVLFAQQRIEALRNDLALRRRIGDAGHALARTLSWQRYANEMMLSFQEAQSHRRSS